jgi:hypothetical protein
MGITSFGRLIKSYIMELLGGKDQQIILRKINL